MDWRTVIVAFLIGVLPRPLAAQATDKTKEILATIRDVANAMCTTPPFDQKSQRVELSGEAKAKLKGLLGKVADMGVAGVARYTDQQSQGVLQAELAKAIKDGNECRLSVFNKLIDKLMPDSPPKPTKKTPNRFNKPSGYFLKQGSAWIEYPPYGPNQNFMFRDFGSDEQYVFLIDPTRTKGGDVHNAMLVRLPIHGGSAQWSYQNPIQWTDFTIVNPTP